MSRIIRNLEENWQIRYIAFQSLLLVLIVGMTASLAAVSAALRIPLLPALKTE